MLGLWKSKKVSRWAHHHSSEFIYGISTAMALVFVLLHFSYGFLLQWLLAIAMSVVLLMMSTMDVVTLQEFHDEMGFDSIVLEKVLNPTANVQIALRLLHFLQLIYLGVWVLPIALIAPVIFYELFFRPVPKVDATRLWQDVHTLMKEARYKLFYGGAMFLIVLGVVFQRALNAIFELW